MSALRPVLFLIAGLASFVLARPGELLRAEERVPFLDSYGDPLPQGAVMRLGTARFRDNGRCCAVAYSPDGKLLASAGYGGVVLWDPRSGKRQGFLESRAQWAAALGEFNHGTVYRLAFSSDGRYLAAGCAGATLVWELATGKAFYLPGDRYKSGTDLVGFAPDNRGVFTGGSDVQLRDWRTGQALKQWTPPLPPASRKKGERGQQKGVGFGAKTLSADGKIVVAHVYDYERNKFSLRVWDVGSGEDRQMEGVHGSLALSPDHTLLAALGEKLTLFDMATGKVVRSWPVNKRKSSAEIGPLAPSTPRPQEVVFSPDGKSVAIPGVVWSVRTGKKLCKLDDDGGPVFGLCFSPDGKTLAIGRGSWIDFWKLPTGMKVHNFPNHCGWVVDLAYSPDGRQLATAGHDIRLWDTRTGRLIRVFEKHKYPVQSLAFFPDGQRLATNHSSSVLIWDVREGRKLRVIRLDPRFAIECFAIAPDGKILLAAGGSIYEWDEVSGEKRRHFGTAGASETFTLAISPDGKLVATANTDRSVRLWDRATGKLVHQLSRNRLTGISFRYIVSFSPDGNLLAAVCGDGGVIDLCDVALGRYRDEMIPYPKREGESESGRLCSLAISPDGKTIISSAQAQGTIRLIEAFSGQERLRFKTLTSKVVFAPDGKTVASESLEGGALIWDLTGQHQRGKSRREPLSTNDLEHLWAELASTDATVAHRAIWSLIAEKKESMSYLRSRVHAVPGLSAAQMKELIDGLDSDSFQERERASRELADQGETAKSALLTIVAKSRSMEQRRRAKYLLAALPTYFLPSSQLRLVRAIEIFEQIASREARAALADLAKGVSGRVETEQAQAALQRLRKQNR